MNMNAMLIRSSILMVVALVLAFTAVRQMPSAHAQSVGTHATAQAVIEHIRKRIRSSYRRTSPCGCARMRTR